MQERSIKNQILKLAQRLCEDRWVLSQTLFDKSPELCGVMTTYLRQLTHRIPFGNPLYKPNALIVFSNLIVTP